MKIIKKSLILLSLLAISTLFVGCNGTSSSDTSSQTSFVNSEFEDPVVDEIVEGAYGGWLEDVCVFQRILGDNSQYLFSYRSPNNDLNLTMQSSDENVLTIEKDSSSSDAYKFVTHNPGNAIFTIYDSEGYLYFRKIVRVRTAYTSETIADAVYDNDIYTGFVGFGGNYRLNCFQTSPDIQFELTGKDEVETNGMDIIFSCNYEGYHAQWDMFYFSTTTVSEHENNQTDIVYIYISRTADMINLYYDIGGGDDALLNVFSPQKYSSFREYF